MQVNRRHFLQLSAGACLASSFGALSLPESAFGDEPLPELKVVTHKIKVGAEKPFTAIHISDTHLTFADERETERKQKLAENRLKYFGKSERFLYSAVKRAQEKDAVLLHTGDMVDFLSDKNFEFVKNFYDREDSTPHFVSSGNHEFSHYLGEAKEDEAYKNGNFDRVQRSYPNDLRFASRVINGVNFVAFDDVYYYVADDLIDRMKAEVEKGLPIVTMCHVPFYTPKLYHYMIAEKKFGCAWVTAVPDEAIKEYDQEKNRYQAGNEATHKFVAWLREQSLVKALLCGHLHLNYEDEFSATARQYVVGGNFKGDAYEFQFE